jgi:hypothetical protein
VVEVSSFDRPVMAEGPTGRLRGTVWDSLQGGPLADAEVYLSGTRHTARTDAEGAFYLEGIPPGTYQVAFRHVRLESVGVYPPAVLAAIRPAETAEVATAVPSSLTVLGALCAGADPEAGASALVGTVRRSAGGEPVPGARVSVEWTRYRTQSGREILGDVQTLELTADERGRYRACGIPPGVLVAARASSPAGVGPIRRTEIGRESFEVLELTVEAGVRPPTPRPLAPRPPPSETW